MSEDIPGLTPQSSADTTTDCGRAIPKGSNGHCGAPTPKWLGNKYILVVCDYATRYPEAVPMKSVDAKSVAEEMVKMFARVGLPEEILTDQGSNFTCQLLAEMYRLIHVHSTRTSPYHPQTDGVVERFNETLKVDASEGGDPGG